MKKLLKKVFPSANQIIDKFLIKELVDCKTILDLGCGPHSPLINIKKYLNPNLYSVGVDNFEPYLEKNILQKNHSEYIKGDILEIDFNNKKFDCVLLVDVIEHFEEKEFINLLIKLEKISNKIIVITPNGFIEQDGYDNNIYQIHKSGWSVEKMKKLGFTCFGVTGLKYLRGKGAKTIIKPNVLGNFLSNITEYFVFNRPKLAYHLMCVKKNKN